ncbi:MAG: 30S ribosomal protein S16 [Thermodesulfovibrionales bacterium]
MVKIRLMRIGAHKRPYYRIVVADSRTRRDGPYIELLGTYDPLKDSEVKIDKDKAKAWIQKGAQPTESVKKLLTRAGL